MNGCGEIVYGQNPAGNGPLHTVTVQPPRVLKRMGNDSTVPIKFTSHLSVGLGTFSWGLTAEAAGLLSFDDRADLLPSDRPGSSIISLPLRQPPFNS